MFLPLPPEIFFTKNDLEDIRLGDLTRNTKFEDLLPHDVVILGYPDDEGIKLNGGRPGAYEAPKIIRQFLYKMTPSYKKTVFNKKIHDYGDLITATHDLASRHEHVRNHVFKCLNQKVKTISFGGGHDYGYADAAAFLDYYKDTHPLKPIIINFDAHMDVRPPKNGPNSGTPFYRLYEAHPEKFHLIEVGIQPQCNSPHHVRWAKDRNIEVIDLETIETQGWSHLWTNTELKRIDSKRPVFVSFDIDALTASEAGGCSQAWATGLHIRDCLLFLTELYKKASVSGLGIYEVSPPLDRDYQTSKTAALLAHHFIFNND